MGEGVAWRRRCPFRLGCSAVPSARSRSRTDGLPNGRLDQLALSCVGRRCPALSGAAATHSSPSRYFRIFASCTNAHAPSTRLGRHRHLPVRRTSKRRIPITARIIARTPDPRSPAPALSRVNLPVGPPPRPPVLLAPSSLPPPPWPPPSLCEN
jgi:hypothetical protein